ncbi:MAG: N-methyl-L-tryptophan oxidase [Bdellovibrionales bacterium]|nr:N-methyl-L-tryptophan oxidase [Bdellovibrionales bacterium]
MSDHIQHYEVIVLGLGAMGSAVMYELSQSKIQCLGIEQFTPIHDLGSSHGQTRVIRKAYFEHPDYVPLVLESYKFWEKYEKEFGVELLVKCGLFTSTDLDHPVYQGSRLSAQKHYVEFEELNQIDLAVKFPSFSFFDQKFALYEPSGGYLFAERALECWQKNIHEKYATLQFEEKVQNIEPESSKVTVTTNKNIYSCDQLIVCAGAWAKKFIPHVPLQAYRMTYHVFEHDDAKDIPIFFFNTPKNNWLYGFPPIDGKMKIAYHNVHEPCDPDTVNRFVQQKEIESIYEEARAYLPKLGKHVFSKVCLYTMTPDEHFIVCKCSKYNNINIAAGFSGHGFKFSPVVARALVDLATQGKSIYPIEFLHSDRFSN